MPTKTSIPKPAYKWVGGKGQICDILYELAPKEFEMYFEPFAGGLAFFFKLVREGRISAALLSDLNPQLMITVSQLHINVEEVISLLKSPIFQNTEKNYYAVRAWDRTSNWQEWMNDKSNRSFVAARVIFLTKLSFNGLWRVNSKGQHNAPFCKDETKNIVDEKNLRAVSKALKGIQIARAGFEYLGDLWEDENESWAMNGYAICPTDFVYFDPPYVQSWSDYTSEGWNMKDLENVSATLDLLTDRGTFGMVSMKDTPEVRELFAGYRIVALKTHCRINRDSSKRKDGMSELIIMNYDENDNILPLPKVCKWVGNDGKIHTDR